MKMRIPAQNDHTESDSEQFVSYGYITDTNTNIVDTPLWSEVTQEEGGDTETRERSGRV
jgi:hypothetical protein